MAASPHGNLQTHENAKGYDRCIRAALGDGWDIALYPPLPVESFGLGTIFALYSDGSITTFSNNSIPLQLWNARNARTNSGTPQHLNDVVASGGIRWKGSISLWDSPPGSRVSLRPDIPYDYVLKPGDAYLKSYTGYPGYEGAMLMVDSGSSVRQSLRSDGPVLHSEWWSNLKYQKFEDEGAEELSMVTDICSTYHWVLDYRSPSNQMASNYVVNCQENGFPAPNFECHHDGSSNNVLYSPEHREYTVLASKIKVRRCNVGGFGRWTSALKAMPFKWRTFRARRRKRPQETELTEYQQTTVDETVSEMYLGGNLSLIEITGPDNVPRYSLEHQGPGNGSWLSDYKRALQAYAVQNSCQDWRELLPKIFYPPPTTEMSQAPVVQQTSSIVPSTSTQYLNHPGWPAPMGLYSQGDRIFTPYPSVRTIRQAPNSAPQDHGGPVYDQI